jgi:60 kDa SS-A/Ro ribonucleoprotein
MSTTNIYSNIYEKRENKTTPQNKKIKGSDQKRNSAGGFSYVLDEWKQLERFLVLGVSGNTFYATQEKVTKDNTKQIEKCIKEDGARVVDEIVRVSKEGLAVKNDPAIFALSMCVALGDEKTRSKAYSAIKEVCRTGSHLFTFPDYLKGNFRNSVGSAGFRRAMNQWYNEKDVKHLAYQVTKYQKRKKWSHRDLLRLSHVKPVDEDHNRLFNWIVNGWNGEEITIDKNDPMAIVWAMEATRLTDNPKDIIMLIKEFGLTWEMVPTQFLKNPDIWEALLEKMPLDAMITNLGRMTSIGLVKPLSQASKKIITNLDNEERIRKSRLHPLSILVSYNAYKIGHGEKGNLTWNPDRNIVDALNEAFYTSFKTIEPTNKNFYLGVDVSGSMTYGEVAGMTGVTPNIGAAVMAMVTARTEKYNVIRGFTSEMRDLGITPKDSLETAQKKTQSRSFGSTDCAQPMIDALNNKLDIDVFEVLTDSETWAGRVHPTQALDNYNQKMGKNAKLVCVGMVANKFSIADATRKDMLDCCGFSAETPQVISLFAKE